MNSESSILQIFNDSDVKVPLSHNKASAILKTITEEENVGFEMVELVYVDEQEIVRINNEHLNRYYVTDIISFRYDDGQQNNDDSAIEGTLYCCAPRILEQSSEFKEPVEREFQRIFIHGLLHLCGYEDTSPDEKKHMTDLENTYLKQIAENK